ncbi:unnamed protein product [Adineta steineri]|uniref:Uncharacterized protein n=1 Tax=Adineta steineri TaxID=433720 RepID=A0A816EPE3_9BILA|nr:unnamed protein product [Adineta steineri]CAF1648648.1 unnamed protein product [Adineta steineri]
MFGIIQNNFFPRLTVRSHRICYIFLLILFVFVNISYRSDEFVDKQSAACAELCPYSSILKRNSIEFNVTHTIRHYPDFVCPQNFRNLADWIFGWPNQFEEHLDITTDDGKRIAPCLPSGSIIYVRIWAIDEFFRIIYPHLQNHFVLITGEGDISSPNDLQYLERSDSKIIHWFGQNGQYDVSRIKKFTHIPIGKSELGQVQVPQEYVPSILPQVQVKVPSTLPKVQVQAPGILLQVQVPSTLPQVQVQVPSTSSKYLYLYFLLEEVQKVQVQILAS